MTTSPNPSAAPTTRTPPASVRLAVILFLTDVVLGLVNSALTLALPDQPQAQLPTGIVIGVLALAILVFYILFIVMMRAGKNWARITLTVLAPLTVIGGSLVFSDISALLSVGGLGLAKVVIAVVELILVVAAVVFMYRPDSNTYFTQAR
ncbi:MAG: hypothetical protein ACR2GH_21715 [Pseudonocardia sp.]